MANFHYSSVAGCTWGRFVQMMRCVHAVALFGEQETHRSGYLRELQIPPTVDCVLRCSYLRVFLGVVRRMHVYFFVGGEKHKSPHRVALLVGWVCRLFLKQTPVFMVEAV